MPRKYKIFLDTSALISGLNSPNGGAGIILSAFLSGKFYVYVSAQVIEEAERNINSKFPDLKESFLNFLLARPKITKEPSLEEIRKAHQLILTEDAPILAAAIKAKPDFLITWDIKHFTQKSVAKNVSFVICTPKEFIQQHWQR